MTDPYPPKKPCIALMGEFSAGKSTLCNLLLQSRILPEQVTATRLPPIWFRHAPGDDHRLGLDGNIEPIDGQAVSNLPIDGTRAICLYREAEILQRCDLIDFPGISDPNIGSEIWDRVIGEASAVIWLTHATQAWRQSEIAVWESLPVTLRAHSVLLVTRFDKLTSDRDKRRVLARLAQETNGLFDKIFPISLLQAVHGQGNPQTWESSGAPAVLDHLNALIDRLSLQSSTQSRGSGPEHANPIDRRSPGMGETPSGTIVPRRVHSALGHRRAERRRRPGAAV